MAVHNRIEYPVNQIRNWISDGKTHEQIAGMLRGSLDPRVTAKLVGKVCKRESIKCQRRGPRAAEGHPNWLGGRRIGKGGYIEVYQPDHPLCQRANQKRRESAAGFFRKKVYVREHRLVMEQHLGRFLRDKEVVHHLNGVQSDNRIENLLLYSSNGDHLRETLKGQVPKWTADGKRRIAQGQKRKVDRQRANRQLASIALRSSGLGVVASI